MLKVGSIIELLDHSEYLIISKVNDNNKDYVLMMNKDDVSDIRICLVQDNDITEVEDKNLLDKLALQFFKDISTN